MDDREQRNAVFTAGQQQQPAQPGMMTTSVADRLKSDFGVTIPVELVPLPSLGKVYSDSNPFYGKEAVEITAMTAREEDILTSRALIKKGTVISELLRSCLVEKRVNVGDMLVGDRNAVMIAIRITGYGADYEVEVECPSCNTRSKQNFNLAELPVRSLGLEPVSPGSNVFEFVLPISKKIVHFKFLTGRDEEDMAAAAAKTKKAGFLNENAVTSALMSSILSIDGVSDRSKIAQFIKSMPARDSLSLRTYINDNQPDVVTKQSITCPSCDATEEVSMPIGVSFFWPNS